MNPPDGIWLATDHELTNSLTGQSLDSFAQKQLLVIAYDGHALMGMTGVARTPSGQNITDWLADRLTNGRAVAPGAGVIPGDPRSIGNELDRIREHLQRAFTRWGWHRHELRLVGAAYESGRPFWFAIANADRDGNLFGRFDLVRRPVEVSGGIADVDGSGRGRSPVQRLVDLTQKVSHHPRDPRDYMTLLATEVEYVGERAPGVSPWSHVTYLPPDVFPIMGKAFARNSAGINRSEPPVTIVMHATQVTPIVGDLMARERLGKKSVQGYEWQFGPTGSELLVDSSDLDCRPTSRVQRRQRARDLRKFHAKRNRLREGGA